MSISDVDQDKLKNVIEQNLRLVPKKEWSYLPPVLLEPGVTRYFVFLTNKYIILDFVDEGEAKRIKSLTKHGLDPFPGLIRPDNASTLSTAIALDKAKNTFVKGCTMRNMYSFSVGKDSSVVIQDHKQSITTEELRSYEYTIKLVYLISFGDEVTYSNFYDTLENLMIESFRRWGVQSV